MTKSILPFLSRLPDELIGDNVFFHTLFDEQIQAVLSSELPDKINLPWSSVEEYHELNSENIKNAVKRYKKDGFLNAKNDLRDFIWASDPQLCKMLSKIAYDKELVLDLASDFYMGLIPSILKYNPTVHAYVSDINGQCMKTLYDYLREYVPEYNINVASFDNNDIPIKDNSLKYITSISGMTSSVGERGSVPLSACCLGREKSISEVYRILKPGGYFVTVEQFNDCDCDIIELYEYCQTYGKLFGIYSFEEIKTVVEWILKDSWKEAFTSAGFEIEAEKDYFHRLTASEFKRLMFQYTYFGGFHSWTDTDIALNYLSNELMKDILAAQSPDDILESKSFLKEWSPIGACVTKKKRYCKEDIARILWEYVKLGSAAVNFEPSADNVLDIYSGEVIYILKKTIYE